MGFVTGIFGCLVLALLSGAILATPVAIAAGLCGPGDRGSAAEAFSLATDIVLAILEFFSVLL